MRGKIIFAVLLTIVTLFSAISARRPDRDDPDYPGESIDEIGTRIKEKIEKRLKCEIMCKRSGKWPICGSDGCTYSGLKELQCFQGCGRKITKQHDKKCNNPPSKPTSCPR